LHARQQLINSHWCYIYVSFSHPSFSIYVGEVSGIIGVTALSPLFLCEAMYKKTAKKAIGWPLFYEQDVGKNNEKREFGSKGFKFNGHAK